MRLPRNALENIGQIEKFKLTFWWKETKNIRKRIITLYNNFRFLFYFFFIKQICSLQVNSSGRVKWLTLYSVLYTYSTSRVFSRLTTRIWIIFDFIVSVIMQIFHLLSFFSCLLKNRDASKLNHLRSSSFFFFRIPLLTTLVLVRMKEDFYRLGFSFEVKLIKVQARMEIMAGKMKRRASNAAVARTHRDRDNCISTSTVSCPFSLPPCPFFTSFSFRILYIEKRTILESFFHLEKSCISILFFVLFFVYVETLLLFF